MRTGPLPLLLLISAVCLPAATDVRVDFTLHTSDAYGNPVQQKRFYYVYRPENLPKDTSAPMVLLMDNGVAGVLHRKADQAGFLVVSCFFTGNSMGGVWNNDDPRITGFEDFDYTTEVINRVRASDNGGDAFIAGLSKGGHMSLAYACERPDMIRAAASLDEFMGLTSNIPKAPLPVIVFEGTSDTNVPYTMVKDTVDAWRAVNGLLNVSPVTTYEASPRIPGKVSQATWRGGTGGSQVAFVTIVGGTHTYPTPAVQTGYDFTDGLWAFFSQFLTEAQGAPKIVSQPVDNVQTSGQPASFHVAATGSGPISYQWQRNGEDIPGATENWLTVPAVSLADDGATFQVVASNDSGAVTSVAAGLTVKPAPTGPAIDTQPAGQAVVAGQPVTFTVGAAGAGPLKYQWRKNGVDIAGATAASLSIPAATPADSGATYSVAVANADGEISSTRATLTVTPAPGAPIILTNPARARILNGQRATYSVTAWSASPMTFQWQKGTFTGNMADIPGATDAVYTTPTATLADHITLFRCVVSNESGSTASASEMLFVTAEAKPPTDITSSITAAAQFGFPFQYTIASSGGTAPIIYSAGPLPAGLSLDPDSGRISGIPAEPGTFIITMEARNAAGKISRTLSLDVGNDPPAIPIDSWRLANFGASAIDPSIAGDAADPDGDGWSNLDEFNAGSNPLDSSSLPAAPAP